MGYILEGFKNALKIIISADREIIAIVLVSLKITACSTFMATLTGVPLGFYIAMNKFKGRRILITIINSLMALPTVIIGLMVYSFISRRGPLGTAGLLYTPWAMIIGQIIL